MRRSSARVSDWGGSDSNLPHEVHRSYPAGTSALVRTTRSYGRSTDSIAVTGVK